jgi:hypothetical protein
LATLVACSADATSHAEHSISLKEKWGYAPVFRVNPNEEPPPCDDVHDGATAMRADGIMCVCEQDTKERAWAMVGSGLACWQHASQ